MKSTIVDFQYNNRGVTMDKKWVNVEMDTELVEVLDQMVKADESDRSKFIRRLIRQELGRRQQLELTLSTEKKSRRTSVVA